MTIFDPSGNKDFTPPRAFLTIYSSSTAPSRLKLLYIDFYVLRAVILSIGSFVSILPCFLLFLGALYPQEIISRKIIISQVWLSGTLLLPESYNSNERFKAQAVNDFGVFLTQALASLSAGIILFSQGWNLLIYITIPIILLMFMMSIWFYMIRKREVS